MKQDGDFSHVLKREGLKNTKKRNAILANLEKCKVPLSAEDIYLKLKDDNISINLSTVYRTLDTLVSRGLVIKTNISDDQKAFFEINRYEHIHHLVCVECKKMIPIEGCPFMEFEKKLQGREGFDITGHRLEIYGMCGECKKQHD